MTAQFYVKVPGGKPPAPGSGFYFVDVHVLQANLLEAEYFRHFVTGAQLVPARAELTPGESEQQREHEDVQMMADSQQVAQAVAERALGLHVKISGDGLFVDSVAPHYPAAKAGVQAGSQLTAIDGTPLQSLGDLRRATAGVHPGDTVRYTFRPGGARVIRTVAAPGTHDPVIGIGVAEQLRISHLSVPVRFLTQGIGGPSAGLAFTLEIYDALSGRHLLRGHRIAATGTIALNGAVGRDRRCHPEDAGRHLGRRRHLHRAPRGRQLPRRGGRSARPNPDHRGALVRTSAARYPGAAAGDQPVKSFSRY